MGSMPGPNCVMAKDVKSCTYCCYVRCATLIVWVGGMPWPKTGATQYHAQLGLPEKVVQTMVGCLQWFVSRAFRLAKESGPWLMSIFCWGMNRIKYMYDMLKSNCLQFCNNNFVFHKDFINQWTDYHFRNAFIGYWMLLYYLF